MMQSATATISDESGASLRLWVLGELHGEGEWQALERLVAAAAATDAGELDLRRVGLTLDPPGFKRLNDALAALESDRDAAWLFVLRANSGGALPAAAAPHLERSVSSAIAALKSWSRSQS